MEMEGAPKRARAGGGEAPDRFSALPDELLRRVLSFLPSRQAVQTTVLYKRWIDLWRLMPAIDHNIREFKCRSPAPGQYEKTMWGKMENFTTNLLMRHRPPRLDAFRLHTGLTSVICRRDVDRWIRRAIEYCPVELEITDLLSVSYRPPKLFSCHLKRLVLSGVYLEHNFGEQLRSECRILEDPVLWQCQKFLVEASISLTSDQLSRRGEAILLASGQPILTSLELKSFNVMYDEGTEREVQMVNKTTLKTVRPVVGPNEFPILENLRTLLLDECDLRDNIRLLRHFLQSSPNLEKLTVRLALCKVAMDDL
ncbi:hypothetical protein C2845_PM16G08240 [Panicum miliaceum]|uniref:F-box domain-containing protein n=1 Tax=Panicum miliaceum TaxID=4540 RepID=A0A3L6PY18_PANMI|nr:hypothetical protein C2845_PM16G08240 [Panicum miliaceum]